MDWSTWTDEEVQPPVVPNQAEISEKARGRLLWFSTFWALVLTCQIRKRTHISVSLSLSLSPGVVYLERGVAACVAVESKSRIAVSNGVDRESECQAGSFLKVADEDENMLFGGTLASRCCTCRWWHLSKELQLESICQMGRKHGHNLEPYIKKNHKLSIYIHLSIHDASWQLHHRKILPNRKSIATVATNRAPQPRQVLEASNRLNRGPLTPPWWMVSTLWVRRFSGTTVEMSWDGPVS